MNTSEILNIVFGGGMIALIIGVITLRATLRKANAEAEQAVADAETVRITNTDQATRILVENIVQPLREELHATREKLSESETAMGALRKEMEATKRAMFRLSRAVESANNCRHARDCPVLLRLQVNPGSRPGADADCRRGGLPGQPAGSGIDGNPAGDPDERRPAPYSGRQPPETPGGRLLSG